LPCDISNTTYKRFYNQVSTILEMFEDTKGVISSSKSKKNRQHIG